jgi:predicted Zn-dependent protease
MLLDRAQATELSYDPSGAFRIDLAGRGSLPSIVFTTLWCAGWALVFAAGLAEFARAGRVDVSLAAWLALWFAGGFPLLIALLWVAGGRCETILIGEGTFRIIRPVGPFRPTTSVDAQGIVGLRTLSAPHRIVADFAAIKGFWTGGSGPIVFRHGRRTYACASALDGAAASKLLADLAALLPHAAQEDVTVPPPPSGAAPWGLACLAIGLIVPAGMLPFKLAVADRAICFCEDPAPSPASPVDASQLSGSGRLVFVPVDGYSSERARELAEHFRKQFGIRIRVEPTLTTGAEAYDSHRDQMNAAAVLTALESRYPDASPRTVVIGLTDGDMYIPDARGRSAPSYRRDYRVAIISSARMDRGCLGLLPVSDERQVARMRKLVGRNIGVMYYRLPFNRDPRSLLYAYVEGPHELDTMSDVF